MANSRGSAISAYVPAFARGAKIYGTNIQSGTVTSANMAAGMNLSGVVTNGTVTSAKLGAAAVRGNKISAGGITSAHIAALTIAPGNLKALAVTSAKIKAAFLSGTLVSGQITKAIAHGMGARPKCVVVIPILTLAQAISAAVPRISLAAASAATSTNIYVIGNQASNAALKYAAYVQL